MSGITESSFGEIDTAKGGFMGIGLFSQKPLKIVNRMMRADIPELGGGGCGKNEDDPVASVHAETPHLIMAGTEFLQSQTGVKGVVLEKIGFGNGFLLNRYGQIAEQLVESPGGLDGNFHFGSSSAKDSLWVTREFEWSAAEPANASRNSRRYNPAAAQKDSKSFLRIPKVTKSASAWMRFAFNETIGRLLHTVKSGGIVRSTRVH